MIDSILSRLEKVKSTGRGTWLACCPAHEDRSPSMTLRLCDDGRILAKCFAECPFDAIVDAVGIGWDDWFPEKPIEYAKPLRRPFPAADVLAAVSDDTLLVAVTVAHISNGLKLTAEDHDKFYAAAGRILEARRLALGQF